MNTAVTGEPALEILTSRLTKIWWRFEALFARWKAAMAEGFEDPYEEEPRQASPFRNRDLAELVRLAGKLSREMNAVSGNHGGNKEHWVDYAFKGLVVIGIAALVAMTLNMRDTVTRIDTYVTAKDKENEREFARIYQALSGYDQRLDRLEQQRRESESDRKHR